MLKRFVMNVSPPPRMRFAFLYTMETETTETTTLPFTLLIPKHSQQELPANDETLGTVATMVLSQL